MTKKKPPKPFQDNGKPHIISLASGRPPISKCTCGWQTEPSEDLYGLASAAFDHKKATGHELRKPPEPAPL